MTECKKCLLNDNIISNLKFNENGLCDYCALAEKLDKKYREHPVYGCTSWDNLWTISEIIKEKQCNKKYDAIVGVSGGCSSTFLLHFAVKRLGLRVLAVHFDNGYNTVAAENNMKKILKVLDVDWVTCGIDKKAMNEINKCFLKASVPDSNIPNRIALTATLYKMAIKYDVKYILDGYNYRYDGVCPASWSHVDAKYMKSVVDEHGPGNIWPMSEFPNLTFRFWLYCTLIKRIRLVHPLHHLDWTKEEIKKFLADEYGFTYVTGYGGQHLENLYTAFCNKILFPQKFGKDRRFIEYSALIRTGVMTKKEAKQLIDNPAKKEKEAMSVLENYLLEVTPSLLDIKKEDFAGLLDQPEKSYKVYNTYGKALKKYKRVLWPLIRFIYGDYLMPHWYITNDKDSIY